MMTTEELLAVIISLGADKAGAVPVDEIDFEPSFRSLCESNACGMYGRSWMCPPHVGKVEDLICQARTYRTALVYQIVDTLEDSYDFEGMMAAGERMNRLAAAVRRKFGGRRMPGLLPMRQAGRSALPPSGSGLVQPGSLWHQCIRPGPPGGYEIYQRRQHRHLLWGGADGKEVNPWPS